MYPNKRDLRAYVRYDGRGRIIPGSLILRRSKPKVGNWKEVSAYLCCGPNPSPFDVVPYADDAGDSPDITTTSTTTLVTSSTSTTGAPTTSSTTSVSPTTTSSTTVTPTTSTTTTIP